MSFLEENNGIYTTFCDIIVYNYRFLFNFAHK